jgi:hypothetical protein
MFQADYQKAQAGEKSDCMEDAARTIMKAFGYCMTDR